MIICRDESALSEDAKVASLSGKSLNRCAEGRTRREGKFEAAAVVNLLAVKRAACCGGT